MSATTFILALMERPRVTMNQPAWKSVTIAALVVALALASALVAQTTLAKGNDSDQSDPLATLALVLAVLAFLLQIFIYVFQSSAALRTDQRAQELHGDTRHLLDEIKATSEATQRVITAQFDRLLDYVVGEETGETSRGEAIASAKKRSRESESTDTGEEGAESETERTPDERRESAAVTWREFDEALRRRDAAARRPEFFTSGVGLQGDDRSVVRWFDEAPPAREVEAVTKIAADLDQKTRAKLLSYAEDELDSRASGVRIGLAVPDDGEWSPATVALIDKGLVDEFDRHAVLTPRGRRVARFLRFPLDDAPEYLIEARRSVVE